MSIPAYRFHHLLGRTHNILVAFTITAVALSAVGAHAADASSQSIVACSGVAAWGAGPITTSLVEVARGEGPLHAVEHKRIPEATANGLILAAYPSHAIH